MQFLGAEGTGISALPRRFSPTVGLFGRFLRFAGLLAGCLILALWAGLGKAEAAEVGMCGELGQSIEAPPPIYPIDSASILECDHGGAEVSRSRGAGLPSERVLLEYPTVTILVLPPEGLRVAPRSVLRIAISSERLRPPAGVVRQMPRPPRAA